MVETTIEISRDEAERRILTKLIELSEEQLKTIYINLISKHLTNEDLVKYLKDDDFYNYKIC